MICTQGWLNQLGHKFWLSILVNHYVGPGRTENPGRPEIVGEPSRQRPLVKRGAVDSGDHGAGRRSGVLLERGVIPFLSGRIVSSVDKSERSVEEAPPSHGHGDLVDGGVRVALRVGAGEVRSARDAAGARSHVRLLDRRAGCGLGRRVGLPVAADDAVVLIAEHRHRQLLLFVGC